MKGEGVAAASNERERSTRSRNVAMIGSLSATKSVFVPGLGDCIFDECYACYGSEPIALPLLGGMLCRVLIPEFQDDSDVPAFIEAIANFLSAPRQVLEAVEPHLFRYYLDAVAGAQSETRPAIARPSGVWRYVDLGAEAIVFRRPRSDRAVYVSLAGSCDWEPDRGLQIVFRNGAHVNKVGPYDGHLTNADAFDDSALEDVIYKSATAL